jgi:hypothetical protein
VDCIQDEGDNLGKMPYRMRVYFTLGLSAAIIQDPSFIVVNATYLYRRVDKRYTLTDMVTQEVMEPIKPFPIFCNAFSAATKATAAQLTRYEEMSKEADIVWAALEKCQAMIEKTINPDSMNASTEKKQQLIVAVAGYMYETMAALKVRIITPEEMMEAAVRNTCPAGFSSYRDAEQSFVMCTDFCLSVAAAIRQAMQAVPENIDAQIEYVKIFAERMKRTKRIYITRELVEDLRAAIGKK